jgi:hypothetical protein
LRDSLGLIFTLPPHRVTIGLVAVLVLALAGCKVEIEVPRNGRVVTSDGVLVCKTGQECIVDVSDTNFDKTFVAVPNEGFAFSHWKKAGRHLCADSRKPCRLFTAGFPGTALMQFLESDESFYLEPVFVDFNQAYWVGVLAEIDTGAFTADDLLYRVQPNIDQCDPGELTDAAKARALEALNEVRALHRLPAVEYAPAYDTEVAQASLIQTANKYLSHFPAPEDACYTAAGADGARSSNLYSGRQSDPASDVFGWTNDNTNLAALEEAGHRRWNLYPGLREVSYGQVYGSSALKVFDFSGPPNTSFSPDLEFVAVPYGIYPYVLVSKGDKPTPWSISILPAGDIGSNFDYFSQAEVSVSTRRAGKRTELRVDSVHHDTKGFGLANFLSWMVDDWDYDTEYLVEISNIRMPGGDVSELSYTVLVDRFNLINLEQPLESADRQQGNTLEGRFDNASDKDSYTVSLSGSVRFSGQSNFSNQGFFILVYDADKRLLKSSDEAFVLNNTGGEYTVVVSPCDENGICYVGVSDYSVTVN